MKRPAQGAARSAWRESWVAVRRNNGAAGIDRIILVDVEEYGVTRLLDELAAADPADSHPQAGGDGTSAVFDSDG